MNTQIFYEKEYIEKGINAQRRYPNEELCRFMGRNYFNKDISLKQRKEIRILEIGCGSCANIWMMAKEGFDVYGCDLSPSSIELGKRILKEWDVSASLTACNMLETPYGEMHFDTVVDVFSSYCLSRSDYILLLKEIRRILKPSGIFFSYFPSKQADTFTRSTLNERYDADTLNGVHDEKSPYYGQDYLFRFMSCEDAKQLLSEEGFNLRYIETTGRTYQSREEYFEWIVFEAISC